MNDKETSTDPSGTPITVFDDVILHPDPKGPFTYLEGRRARVVRVGKDVEGGLDGHVQVQPRTAASGLVTMPCERVEVVR